MSFTSGVLSFGFQVTRVLLILLVGLAVPTLAQQPSKKAEKAATRATTTPSVKAKTPPGFKGVVNLDVRDSKPDWEPFIPKSAPKGAPNVLIVLFDDTGLGAWSPYGGRVNMPTLDRLAKNGLIYTQWHTTALCSPTRSTFLTGRNHHVNGFSCVSEGTQGFPGWSGRIPAQCATIGQVLQDNGFSTFWIGKNHNVPIHEISSGGSRKEWPLQKGFDRFYGFLGGETSQWYPELVEDNRFIEPPATPEEGYHVSKDLADKAIGMLRDQKAANQSRPWFMWLCPGANHAPHHCPQEYIDKYKGKFDDGYDAYRTWVLARMIERGIMPPDTKLSTQNPLPKEIAIPGDFVRPWNSLNVDEKRLFCRMAEVFAGFSEYTDAQVGRVIDYLEKSGQLDNTIVFYCSDNGSSGEGSPNGSVNEYKAFNGFPDDLQQNLQMIDKLGGVDTYNHIPTGWAAAFSTPFQMFKRYSYSGGTCCPLVIHWPKGIKAKGEVRHQFHHSTDIVPTILDVCGLEMPRTYRGVEQYPLSGVSMKYSFEAKPNAPTMKKRQYFAMLGTRSIWENGWKAVSLHAPLNNKGNFDKDQWELYHTDSDRSESINLAQKHPEKLQALIKAWLEEADANFVLPLDDRTSGELLSIVRPSEEPMRDRYTYYPDTAPVPEAVAANTRGRSFKIVSKINVTADNAAGVLFSIGTRFGGYTMYIKDHVLHYEYNFLGIQPTYHFADTKPLAKGVHTVGVEFVKEKTGPNGEHIGTARLYVDGKQVADGVLHTQPANFGFPGSGLTIGYSAADAVSTAYRAPARLKGADIEFVTISTEKLSYSELVKEINPPVNP